MSNTAVARIECIEVKGLFGLYNHQIPLRPERVTVIHGPNGVGKTVLLNMLYGLLRREIGRFEGIRFSELTVRFVNGSQAKVTHANSGLQFQGAAPDLEAHLIEIKRLDWQETLNPTAESTTPIYQTLDAVQHCADEMRSRLTSKLEEYGKRAEELDRTFPQRLIMQPIQAPSRSKLEQDLEDIERKRKSLMESGILENTNDISSAQVPLSLIAANDAQMAALSAYVSDTLDKLKVFDELSEKAKIFLSLLNKKFINKVVNLSHRYGIQITSHDDTLIPIHKLSSGEQHELVLLYDLLFKIPPNALVLIDEPELSLHLGWQKTFIDDLLSIIQINPFDVILATHSPYIVGEHEELMVELSARRIE